MFNLNTLRINTFGWTYRLIGLIYRWFLFPPIIYAKNVMGSISEVAYPFCLNIEHKGDMWKFPAHWIF